MATPLASGTTAILLATGAGVLAIVVIGVVVWATLGGEDRGAVGQLVRHPIRTIFVEDPRHDEDDEPL